MKIPTASLQLHSLVEATSGVLGIKTYVAVYSTQDVYFYPEFRMAMTRTVKLAIIHRNGKNLRIGDVTTVKQNAEHDEVKPSVEEVRYNPSVAGMSELDEALLLAVSNKLGL